MEVKRVIGSIAQEHIDEFDPEKHMNYSFAELGYSWRWNSFLWSVERKCDVFIPEHLKDKLRHVSDVVIVVENLKRVKAVKGAWVQCKRSVDQKCPFVSSGRRNSTLRSNISPNDDFCNAMSCGWYFLRGVLAKIK